MSGSSRLKAIWALNKSWPILLVALLLTSIVLFFVNQNLVAPGVALLERNYIVLQERSRQARKVKMAADNPNTVYQRGVDDLEKFRALIPARSELTGLVAELFKLADSSSLAITQVNYQPDDLAEQRLLKYKLVFNVSGQYDQLKKFIALIESSARLIAIESIALRSESRSGNHVTLQLELGTYFKAGVV